MTKLHKRQKGMTAISMVALLALIGFVLLIVAKLVPLYFENFKIATAVTSLEKDSRAEGASKEQIRTLIMRRLQIDDVDRITPKDVQFEKKGAVTRVFVKYEARVNVLSNVDAVVDFDEISVELR